MNNDLEGFNFTKPTESEMSGQWQPVPDGEYALVAHDAIWKDTANGRRLNVTFKIVGGDFDGQFVYDGFNLVNSNERAETISRELFAKMATAMGVNPEAIKSTQELLNKRTMAWIVVGEYTNKQGETVKTNNVKKYWAMNGAAATPSPVTTTPQPNGTAQQQSSAPWA